MSAATVVRVSVVLLACALGVRCDRAAPPLAGPTPVPKSNPFVDGFPAGIFTVVSGADQRPIAGASLTVAGSTYQTDGDGKLVGVHGLLPRNTEFTIDAAGYLVRRSMFNHASTIALWPVSGDAEAETVRRMVYARADSQTEVTTGFPSRQVNLGLDRLPAAQRPLWTAPLAELQAALNIVIRVVGNSYDDEDPDVSVAIDIGNAPCQLVAAWGFCRERASGPHTYWLQADRATDSELIQRVVASVFLGANPDAGFMNAIAPARAFSALELQTIGMLLQRPRGNRWPDTDR